MSIVVKSNYEKVNHEGHEEFFLRVKTEKSTLFYFVNLVNSIVTFVVKPLVVKNLYVENCS